MCGIWALLGYTGDASDFINDFHRIAPRGPNGFRFQKINGINNISLGFYRLSIVDTRGDIGMQPIISKGLEHIYSITNGMIYNFKELCSLYGYQSSTECDIEAVSQLYNKVGMPETFTQLDGVFATCLIDTNMHKVYLGRDPFGVKPIFYYYEENGILAVCSEIKGIVNMLQVMKKPITEIRFVPPGYCFEFDIAKNGCVSRHQQYLFNSIGTMPKYKTLLKDLVISDHIKTVSNKNGFTQNGYPDVPAEIFSEIRSYFNAAVKKRLLSDRRIGLLLSGGLDSSLVASIAVKNIREAGIKYPIQTFTIGLEGSPDISAARKVSKFLETEHYEITFTNEEGIEAVEKVIERTETYDITTIRSSVVMYLICAYIRKHTDTVIIFSGEGADELLQGYLYFYKAPSPEDADNEGRRLLRDLHFFDVLRLDRSASGWGLDARVPFLDHRFTSYILSLPHEYRSPQGGIEKWIIRQAFSGTNTLPDDILWRTKEAFSDGVSSHEKSWYKILSEHLKTKVTDEMLANAPEIYPENTPHTHEAYFYRMTHDKYFPKMAHLTPYYWMPKWSDAKDPSARSLKVYKS